MSSEEKTTTEVVVSNIPNENTKEHKNRSPRPTQLEGEELRAALQKQVEYYFSKENLQTDWYLLSQMNSEMYVPVKTIAEFRMVKNLTTDYDLILSVMKASTVVALDETQTLIRPTVKSIRNTLILREIPSTSEPEEIKAIFKDIKDKNNNPVEIIDLVTDVGDCWYVTLANDEIALSTLDALKHHQFKGQPIQARIKTESVAKNIFIPAGPYPTDPNANPYANPYYPGVYAPYNGAPGANYQYWEGRPYRGGYEGRGRGYGRGRRREYSGRGRGNYRGGSAGKESNGSSTRKRRGSQGANLTLGAADFPPLPSAAFEQSKTRYTDDFIKYSKKEIVDIVSAISEDKITKPEGLASQDLIILDQPQKELEVSKPYPKRVTAADIVQMAPPSPKGAVPTSPTAEKSAPLEKAKSPEKVKSPEKAKSPEKVKSPEKGAKTTEKSSKSEKSRQGSAKEESSKTEAHTTGNAKSSQT